MGKRIRISAIWKVTFVLALISAAVISFFALQIPPKEMMWKEYQQAQICSGLTCRQIQTAVILQSHMIGLTIQEKSGRTRPNNEYYVQVDFGDHHLNEFYLTNNLFIEKNEFGVRNIYLPNKTEGNFMDINFPVGKEIKLELWKGQVTFMFTASLLQQITSSSNQVFQITPVPPSMLEQAKPSVVNEFAIPTTNHPLMALKKAQKDLFDVIGLAIIIVLMIIFAAHRFTRA